MKKWLIGCLTVLAMVCLIPGIVLKAAAETVPVRCPFCGISEEREVRRYEKYDSTYHKVCVDARAATATQKRPHPAAAATRPATVWECAKLAEGVTTAVTHGASGHPPATAHTSAAA